MQARFHLFTAKKIIRYSEPSVKTHPEFGFLSGTGLAFLDAWQAARVPAGELELWPRRHKMHLQRKFHRAIVCQSSPGSVCINGGNAARRKKPLPCPSGPP